MGKEYLRVEPSAVFGLVATYASNVVYLNTGGREARLVAVGACERVLIWDLHTKEKVTEEFVYKCTVSLESEPHL